MKRASRFALMLSVCASIALVRSAIAVVSQPFPLVGSALALASEAFSHTHGMRSLHQTPTPGSRSARASRPLSTSR